MNVTKGKKSVEKTKNNKRETLRLLGERIVYLRKKKGLSQLSLAYLSDVSKTYLSDLERGRRNPSVLVLSRIAKALRVDLASLFIGVL